MEIPIEKISFFSLSIKETSSILDNLKNISGLKYYFVLTNIFLKFFWIDPSEFINFLASKSVKIKLVSSSISILLGFIFPWFFPNSV